MGMFSWDCNGCGFSMRDCKGCSVDSWMGRAVCLTPEGSRVIGYYNSYGQLGEYNLVEQISKFAIYHHACWELAGKPEYDRPARHSRDQGFCHGMHGKPFPKPTSPEWFGVAQMWQALNRVLDGYAQLLCDLDHRKAEKLWDSFTPERQLVLIAEFDAFQLEHKKQWDAKWTAYLHSTNDEELAPKKDEPTEYTFDGVTIDYMWLNHFIRMMKNDY